MLLQFSVPWRDKNCNCKPDVGVPSPIFAIPSENMLREGNIVVFYCPVCGALQHVAAWHWGFSRIAETQSQPEWIEETIDIINEWWEYYNGDDGTDS